MKRFYKDVAIADVAGGFRIHLDNRALKTPKRGDLVLPTRALADAVAGEWQAQGEFIDPVAMPMTGLANAAIDHVAADRDAFVAPLAAYAESDLICYRAESPAPLVARQSTEWDPLAKWAETRLDAPLTLVAGVLPKPQPPDSIAKLCDALAAHDDYTLAAGQPLVTISGSLVIALALLAEEIDAETAWRAGQLDELWQAEQWGDDEDAAATRARRKADFDVAATFAGLARS